MCTTAATKCTPILALMLSNLQPCTQLCQCISPCVMYLLRCYPSCLA
jgi:hypothetical protein